MAKVRVVLVRRRDGSLLIDLEAPGRDCDKGLRVLEALLEAGGMRKISEEDAEDRRDDGGVPIPEKIREG